MPRSSIPPWSLRNGLAALVLALVGSLAPLVAQAQAAQRFPEKPIHIIVPFTAGDANDVQMRTLGRHLSARWGQPVIVENKPGAGTMIATEYVAKAPPDGHTLLFITTSFSINPGLYPKVPYDPRKDFVPLIQTVSIPLIMVGSPQFAPNNVGEVIAYAKQNPGKVSVANSGTGTFGHIGMELLRSITGINFIHVPYKGIPPAMVDLLSGQVNLMATSPAQVIPQIKEGRIKAIGVTSAQRLPQLPNVPTLRESGVAMEVNAWSGMAVPAGTPRDVVAKLNREIAGILNGEMKAGLVADGLNIVAGTPEQFAAHIDSEVTRWAEVIRSGNIKP